MCGQWIERQCIVTWLVYPLTGQIRHMLTGDFIVVPRLLVSWTQTIMFVCVVDDTHMRVTHLFAHATTVTTLLCHATTVTTLLCYHELERAVSDLIPETLTRLQLVCDLIDRHCCN